MVWEHASALALALALSIEKNFPYRSQLLTLTFGWLHSRLWSRHYDEAAHPHAWNFDERDDDYSCARIRQVAISSAALELESMRANNSFHVTYMHNCTKSSRKIENANTAVDSILDDNHDRLSEEFKEALAR